MQDIDAEQIKISVAGRIADGVAIWRAVENGTHDPWLDSQPGGDKAALKIAAADFAGRCSKKFERLFTQPDNATDSAWLQNHLEYQFSVGGQPVADGAQTILFADQYHQGRLDWYSFDAITSRKAVLEPEPVSTPTPEQVILPARECSFQGPAATALLGDGRNAD